MLGTQACLINSLGARIQLPSGLNVSAWQGYAAPSQEDRQLIYFIKYGFPLGYPGPKSNTADMPNHDTAVNFPAFVHDFIQEEIREEAFLGPFPEVPFFPWAHTSPVMTRPKSDPTKRRVITDLTFPQSHSVNAYIMKNSALGEVRDHTLPSITDLVDLIQGTGTGSVMFTIDISRAYRNFRTDPIDWPLLCVSWDGAHYIDVSMPFGARASLCHMQRVADLITRILAVEGITGVMYLEDLIVVSLDMESTSLSYQRVKSLLHELGAAEKAQPPATAVRWLGINID